MSSPAQNPLSPQAPKLARRLGLFDASMIVMGGIVGAGIFINPYVVAQQVHTPVLILGAWVAGGFIALLGAFMYAELAARMPDVGGQYAYLRETYHPAIAFLYGWVLLLVIQTGGMAAVSITFAGYFLDLTGAHASDWLIGAIALAALTIINCLGVKQGSAVQSALMIMKIAAITGLVFCGAFLLHRPSQFVFHPLIGERPSWHMLSTFGAAMVPVLFAYGGWQTANFVGAEINQPRRNLPRAQLIGVCGVIALYVGVNWVCLRALGAAGLAQTHTPAPAVMRFVLGSSGVKLIAVSIAVSTLGFLSQSILTAPRVYFAMAEDGLFFRAVARVHPRTRVPVAAILLQSLWTMVIAASGRYEQILNYVVSMDFIFFGLTATCIFVLRRRDRVERAPDLPDVGRRGTGFRVPGHPVTTTLFIAACWLVVANTIYRYPANSLVGMAMLAAGVPVYLVWSARRRVKRLSGDH